MINVYDISRYMYSKQEQTTLWVAMKPLLVGLN